MTTIFPPWTDTIREATERGYFTQLEIKRARNWFSCGCGEQDHRIPRDPDNGRPLDYRLEILGVEFFSAVGENHMARASGLLRAIEKRAQEILSSLEG